MNSSAVGAHNYITWSSIEVVITRRTRNPLALRGPWVRIPPAPPKAKHLEGCFFYMYMEKGLPSKESVCLLEILSCIAVILHRRQRISMKERNAACTGKYCSSERPAHVAAYSPFPGRNSSLNKMLMIFHAVNETVLLKKYRTGCL